MLAQTGDWATRGYSAAANPGRVLSEAAVTLPRFDLRLGEWFALECTIASEPFRQLFCLREPLSDRMYVRGGGSAAGEALLYTRNLRASFSQSQLRPIKCLVD